MHRWLLWFFVGFCSTGVARAETPLRIDQSGERMRVDGSLREWSGAHFTLLGGSGDTTLRYALATADGGLYIGADVRDDQLVRSAGVGPRQDAIVLTLAMPDQDGALHSTEIWLHPGESGRTRAEAGLRSGHGSLHPEPKIKVVEGPRDQDEPGYVLEAFIPWSLVEFSDIWEQGRGALRLEDVDAGAKAPIVLQSANSEPLKAMPRLALGVGQKDFLGSFLSSQNLIGVEPRFDFRRNVYGDASPERVLLVDRFVMVYGPGYQRGESYGFLALPIGIGGGIKGAELMDLTADGREELVVTLRQRNDLGAREVWMVYTLAEDTPRALFGVELKKEVSGGTVENALSMVRRGKAAPHIEVKISRVQNLDAETYQEGSARDVQAILLPWGEVRARTYGYDGTAFVVLEEEQNPGARAAAPARVAAPVNQGADQVRIEPSVNAVLALFQRDRKLPATQAPLRQEVANVGAGPAREQLFQFAANLVLVGPDIGGGGSYVAYSLPVTDPADIVYVGHADVTGDGREELFVRLKQPLGGAQGVYRELVLVLRVDDQWRFSRLLTAEVTRRQGASVVANRVLARAGRLIIEPGTAQGWDESSYPFTNEATGGAERLLLPWADAPQRYRFSQERLVSAQ